MSEFNISELQLLRGLLHSELLNTPDKLVYEEWRNLIKSSINKVDKLEEEILGE